MSRDHESRGVVRSGSGYDSDVLLLDDASGTFNWVVSGAGGDDVAEYGTAAALFGAKGIHLKTRTTDAADGDTVAITRAVGHPERERVLLRCYMCLPDMSDEEFIDFKLGVHDGVREYSAWMRMKPNVPSVSYYGAGGTMVALSGLGYAVIDGQWSRFEVVIDVGEHEYLDVLWMGKRLSMADLGFYNVGASTDRKLELEISIEARVAAAAELFLDMVYLGERSEI